MRSHVIGLTQLGFALALVILVLLGLLSYRATREMAEAAWWRTHTVEVLEVVEALGARLADVESGDRGYALTGSDSSLETYRRGLDGVGERLGDLRRMTADNPAQQRRLDELEPVLRRQCDYARGIVEARRAGHDEGARRLVVRMEEEKLTARARGLLGALEYEERRLLLERQIRQGDQARLITAAVATGSMFAFALVAGSGALARVRFVRQRRAEADLREARASLERRVGERTAELAAANEQLRREARERRLAEACLRESEARFRATFEQAAVGVAHVGPDGRWLRVNRRLCEIVGYDRDELLTKTFQDITHPDDLESDLGQLRRTLAGEITTYTMEKRYFRKGGAVVWINLTVSLVREGAEETSGRPAYFIAVVEDVSARRAAEAALRDSEARFARFMRHLPGLAWVKDVQGRYVYANEAAEAAFGVPRAGLYGKTDDDFFPPETARQFRANDGRVLATRDRVQVIETLEHEDGSRHYSIVNKFLIPGPGGEAALVGGVAFDVTERMRAEQALRESEARFHQLADAMPQIVWVSGAYGRTTYLNRRWHEYTGRATSGPDDLRQAVHPDDLPPMNEAWEKALAAAAPFQYEFRLRGAGSGAYRWFLARAVPVRDPGGAVVQWFGTSTDIDDRVRAERRLRELNATLEQRVAERTAEAREQAHEAHEAAAALRRQTTLLRAVLDSMAEGVTVADASGRMTLINPAGRQILGRGLTAGGPDTWPEHYGVFLPDGVAPFPTDQIPLTLAIRGQESQDVELVIRNPGCPEGRVLHVSGRPIRGADGTVQGGVVAYHDVTADRRNREALARANAELARSNDELQQFAYVASHDLQEPLRMVASYLQLLERRYAPRLDDAAREFIGFAVDGAKRMQTLIRDLLQYSRVSTHARPHAATDCAAVLRQVLDDLTLAAAESGAGITCDPLPRVQGDPTQLGQLFQNLIGNALKFRGPEPPRVHVAAEDRGRDWLFSVRDNGIGIEPQYRERVFVIFQRLHTRDEYPGTGIGLAVCKKIVERHGGRIWVDSEPGRGATFFFSLPKPPEIAA